jgi:hypothetical protein
LPGHWQRISSERKWQVNYWRRLLKLNPRFELIAIITARIRTKITSFASTKKLNLVPFNESLLEQNCDPDRGYSARLYSGYWCNVLFNSGLFWAIGYYMACTWKNLKNFHWIEW